MPHPKRIGLSGPKENGKTTLAEKLIKALPKAIIVNMVDPMVEIGKILTLDENFDKHRRYELVPGKFFTGTEILQKCGTEGGRDVFGEELWTYRQERLINSGAYADADYIIDSSVRTMGERRMLDFHMWIEAPGATTTQNTNHRTESQLADLKKNADLRITRNDTEYTPGFEVIVEAVRSTGFKKRFYMALILGALNVLCTEDGGAIFKTIGTKKAITPDEHESLELIIGAEICL